MTTKVRSSVLADTAVTPEKYGGTQTLQTITVDAQGRITHAANITSGVVTADTTGQGASILVPSIRFNALGQIVEATNTTIRSATTSVTGVVQLVDSVSSTSTTSAATASAVKTAYDAALANTGAALITALNAGNISSGTLPTGRISGSYTGITGVGTLAAGSVPSSLVSGLASSATTDTTSAANISSGTLPAARLSGSYTGITGVGTLSAGSIPASLITGLYPVGSIYINASVATNPGTLLGFGTWVAFGAGRVMVGFNAANALFDAAEETGGSADSSVVSHTHTATVSETPHSHTLTGTTAVGGIGPVGGGGNLVQFQSISTSAVSTGITVSNSTEGSSGTNANYQPYITVYMWKRTA